MLVGPVTFLLLSKGTAGFRPLDLLDTLLPRYADLLAKLHDEGVEWVQLDEPAFAADRTEAELNALIRAYHWLGKATARPKLLVAGYFGGLGRGLGVLARAPIDAPAVDLVIDESFVDAVAAEPALRDKEVVAGVVDGRNVWRTDPRRALSRAATLFEVAKSVGVTTSCSLLHVPYDVSREDLDPRLKDRLAFARQKVDEVVLLGRALRGESVDLETVTDRGTASSVSVLPDEVSRPPYARRAAAQQAAMRAEVTRVVRLQEDLGLDVLVHGEPERNDMVQYFAEQLAGFATTRTAGCSRTVCGASGRRSCTATSRGRRR